MSTQPAERRRKVEDGMNLLARVIRNRPLPWHLVFAALPLRPLAETLDVLPPRAQ